MIITAKMLEKKDACPSQIDLFRETFGEEAKVTLENCYKAARAGLSLGYAAYNLLPGSAWDIYYEGTNQTWMAYCENPNSLKLEAYLKAGAEALYAAVCSVEAAHA